MAKSAQAFFDRARQGVALACVLSMVGFSAESPAPPPLPATGFPTNLPLKHVGPGLLEIGKVRLNQKLRTVSLPAVVNMTEGVLEYLLVTSYGKTHESLLSTDADPSHIHLTMLLLGATGAGTNSFPEDPAKPLPGDRISIELSWERRGKTLHRPAESFVFNHRSQSLMSTGEWVYTGSLILEGTFVAQGEGSIISLITDPGALVNNPRPGREDDERWGVNKAGLPAVGSPVRVTLKLSR